MVALLRVISDDKIPLISLDDATMTNHHTLHLFHAWLLSTDRLDSTVGLRLRYIRALATKCDLLTVDSITLEAILATRRQQAPETRKSVLASWRLFFHWARRRGLRADDPTLDIESVKVRVRVPRLAPDDAVQLAIRHAGLRDRAMIMLARFGCLRLSELTALHTQNRQGDRLIVRGKGDKERIVYANDDLLHVLVQLETQQGRGYYFPGRFSPNEHMHAQSVNKVITRVTGYNPHSLRHAGATAAYRATGDLRGVQEMLGHASLATTERYLHIDDDGRRRLAAATAFPLLAA